MNFSFPFIMIQAKINTIQDSAENFENSTIMLPNEQEVSFESPNYLSTFGILLHKPDLF